MANMLRYRRRMRMNDPSVLCETFTKHWDLGPSNLTPKQPVRGEFSENTVTQRLAYSTSEH